MHHVWVGKNVITSFIGKQNNSLKNFLNGMYTKICTSKLGIGLIVHFRVSVLPCFRAVIDNYC